ncbi:MAG: SusC/RagA family TonB-linked outer membrane protein [Chitinophagaceae bacterium]
MRKFASLCIALLLCTALTYAQQKTVSGRIIDEKGDPIPFSTIQIKGTKAAIVADANGSFNLTLKNSNTLVISAAGFQAKEYTVEGTRTFTVQLAGSSKLIEEVIVTAGGVKTKRKEVGTANTVIKADQLVAGKAINVAGGLQGKVAGLQVSAVGGGINPSYRLILRGQRSLLGNNQALIVLNNVIVPNDILGNLNPDDVEDMVVMNGAGAVALYGSAASNGALIVTTKKGRRGQTAVVLSNTTTVESVAFYPKIQKKFGSGGTAYGLNPDGSPVFNYLENQSYGPAFDGVKRPLGPALEDGSQDSAYYSYNPGHNDFWQKGINNQTNFSLTTGDENSTFYLSGQYATVTGTTPGDKYNRTTLSANGTRRIGNKIMVTYTTDYTQNRYDITTQTASMYANMLNMPSNVDITKYKNWRTDKFANPNGFYNPWYQNPYFTADNYRSIQRNDYLVANVEVKWTPIQGLDITARQGITTRNYSQKNTIGQFLFTTFAKNTDQSSKADIAAQVYDGSNYKTNLLTDLLAQYNKKFGVFSLNVIGGAQWRQDQAKYLNVTANGLVVPGLYNLSNGVGTPTVNENNYKARQFGAYADVRIGYKGYLFLHGTGRNDWVSILDPNNRSFFYPSVDLSFIASEAIDAIKSSKTISFLKLRAGWAKVGQVNLGNSDNFGAYQLQAVYTANSYGFPYGSLPGYTVGNGLVQSGLKPEITKGYEAGFDLNLFNDRFTSNVTYYSTKTDNQTVPTQITPTTGYTNLLTNAGQTASSGLEVTAHFTPIRTKDWSVTFGGNYTYLDNKVNYIRSDLTKIPLSSSGSGASYGIAGQAFPVIMGYDYKRDNAGHVIVNSLTGLPTKSDTISILGNAVAKNKLGLDLAVSYKHFRFSTTFEYRGGLKTFNGMGTELDWAGTGYRTAVYDRKSFVFPNSVIADPSKPGSYITNTTVAIANGNGNNGFWTDDINRGVTSNYITNGSFWKLREIAIAYDIPGSAFGKRNLVKGVTISVQGRNLFIWLPKDNIYTDPEYSDAGADSNGIGLTGLGQTPPSRYYGGTVTFRF